MLGIVSRQDQKWSTCLTHPRMPLHDASPGNLHTNLVAALNTQLRSIRHPLHACALRSAANPATPSGRKQLSWCDSRFLAKSRQRAGKSADAQQPVADVQNWRERLSAAGQLPAAGWKRICQRASSFQAGNTLPLRDICCRMLGVSGFALCLNAMA